MLSETDIHHAKILIVDDQESNIRLLESVLTRANYTSIAATMNPHEVYELHRRNHYDLILLEIGRAHV